MNTQRRINDRIERKTGIRHGSRFILAAMLALGFAVPAHAAPSAMAMLNAARAAQGSAQQYVRDHDVNVTLATIRVPVKLHNLASAPYRVACTVYDRPHGALRSRGDGDGGGIVPASGEVDTTVAVAVHPLKSVSGGASALVTWLCHLRVSGMTSGLRSLSRPGTSFRENVGGRF